MGLNPRMTVEQIWDRQLDEMFHSNESPYFNMFKAGLFGIPIEKIITKLTALGIPMRSKDIQSWQDGMIKRQSKIDPSFKIPAKVVTGTGIPFEDAKLSDFPMFPQSWIGPKRRFFPCTMENKPMCRWGWSVDYRPQLYDQRTARDLSPCRWIGQNMLYQRFIVMDIDGRGHGEDDPWVIAFGNLFKDKTFCMEDPMKPGSFHLYFSTDRLIPVRHFGWAKLDLMGNSVNAAVYLKNKVNNGLSMMQLDEEVWDALMSYQRYRKENCYVS